MFASPAIPLRPTRRASFAILALAIALPALLAPPSRADESGTQAVAKALADAKKKLKDCNKEALDEYKTKIKQAEIDFATGVLTDQTVPLRSGGDTAEFVESLNSHKLYVTFELIQKLSAIIQQHPEAQDALLVGSGGALDQWFVFVGEQCEKTFDKGRKKMVAFATLVQKSSQGTKKVSLQGIPQAFPPEAPGNPKVPVKPLSIVGLGSTHSPQVSNDGKLFVSGLAPAPGAQVVVKIFGPNGETATQTMKVGSDSFFQVTFPSTGAGNLAEGNWRIEATSNGQLATAVHGI